MVDEPQPYISLDGPILIHALTVPGKVNGRNFNLFLGQPGGNLIGSVSFQRHGEDTSHYSSGFFVNNPVFPLLVP